MAQVLNCFLTSKFYIMSIVQNPLIGRTKKSAGGMTFCTLKGQNIMKTKAVSVANPNTEGQRTQRTRLKMAVEIFRSASSFFKAGFSSASGKLSEYNWFMRTNLRNDALLNVAGVVNFDNTKFEAAKGTMPTTSVLLAQLGAGGNDVNVFWNVAIGNGRKASDKAYVLLIDPSGVIRGISEGIATRDAGEVTVSAIDNPATAVTRAVLFFLASDGSSVCDSDNSPIVP
jgi:hypothetical protein